MFHNIEAVSFDAKGHLLLHSSRSTPWDLERDMVQLMFTCPSVSVGSGLMFDHTWHDPKSDAQATGIMEQTQFLGPVPYPKVASKIRHEEIFAYGDLKPFDDRVFAFKGENFLGEIESYKFRFQSGKEHYCSTLIYEGTLSIQCILEEEAFSRLFRPVFLSAANWKMMLTIGVIGFQSGPERAFSEPGDTQHLVIEGDRSISSELRSIQVTKA